MNKLDRVWILLMFLVLMPESRPSNMKISEFVIGAAVYVLAVISGWLAKDGAK